MSSSATSHRRYTGARRGLWAAALVLGLSALVACPGPPASEDGESGESETGPPADDPDHDPLSMPREPTLSPEDFRSASECAGCHPTHYAEWQLSRHARSMRDPVFRALVALRQQDLDGAEGQFCTQCHSAICTRGGDCVEGFSFDALPDIALEGVTCEACHKVSALHRTYNSGHELDPLGPIRGPNADPVANNFHASEGSELFEQAEFCGGCHDVVKTSGLNLERPYAEWLESPAGAGAGPTCQGCHMPTYLGTAGPGGPERELHRHRFIGVDLPMEGDLADDPETMAMLDAQIEELLAGAASLELEVAPSVSAGAQLDLLVTIENLISGHNFPTGSTFLRQVWLELRVTDADATVIYETGQLDSEGDLRDLWSTVAPFSDPDLIVIDSELLDAQGSPELFSWWASEHVSASIPPLHERTHTLFVPVPEGSVGPLEIEAVLHFRSYPPFLLRLLGLEELIPLAPVRDVATAQAQVDVNG